MEDEKEHDNDWTGTSENDEEVVQSIETAEEEEEESAETGTEKDEEMVAGEEMNTTVESEEGDESEMVEHQESSQLEEEEEETADVEEDEDGDTAAEMEGEEESAELEEEEKEEEEDALEDTKEEDEEEEKVEDLELEEDEDNEISELELEEEGGDYEATAELEEGKMEEEDEEVEEPPVGRSENEHVDDDEEEAEESFVSAEEELNDASQREGEENQDENAGDVSLSLNENETENEDGDLIKDSTGGSGLPVVDESLYESMTSQPSNDDDPLSSSPAREGGVEVEESPSKRHKKTSHKLVENAETIFTMSTPVGSSPKKGSKDATTPVSSSPKKGNKDATTTASSSKKKKTGKGNNKKTAVAKSKKTPKSKTPKPSKASNDAPPELDEDSAFSTPTATPTAAKAKASSGSTPTIAKGDRDQSYSLLPNGWGVEGVQRMSGTTVGKYDIYYYSPDGKKLRSKKEVQKFHETKGLEFDAVSFEFNVVELVSSGVLQLAGVMGKQKKKTNVEEKKLPAKSKVFTKKGKKMATTTKTTVVEKKGKTKLSKAETAAFKPKVGGGVTKASKKVLKKKVQAESFANALTVGDDQSPSSSPLQKLVIKMPFGGGGFGKSQQMTKKESSQIRSYFAPSDEGEDDYNLDDNDGNLMIDEQPELMIDEGGDNVEEEKEESFTKVVNKKSGKKKTPVSSKKKKGMKRTNQIAFGEEVESESAVFAAENEMAIVSVSPPSKKKKKKSKAGAKKKLNVVSITEEKIKEQVDDLNAENDDASQECVEDSSLGDKEMNSKLNEEHQVSSESQIVLPPFKKKRGRPSKKSIIVEPQCNTTEASMDDVKHDDSTAVDEEEKTGVENVGNSFVEVAGVDSSSLAISVLDSIDDSQSQSQIEETANTTPVPVKKKRGRPSKSKKAAKLNSSLVDDNKETSLNDAKEGEDVNNLDNAEPVSIESESKNASEDLSLPVSDPPIVLTPQTQNVEEDQSLTTVAAMPGGKSKSKKKKRGRPKKSIVDDSHHTHTQDDNDASMNVNEMPVSEVIEKDAPTHPDCDDTDAAAAAESETPLENGGDEENADSSSLAVVSGLEEEMDADQISTAVVNTNSTVSESQMEVEEDTTIAVESLTTAATMPGGKSKSKKKKRGRPKKTITVEEEVTTGRPKKTITVEEEVTTAETETQAQSEKEELSWEEYQKQLAALIFGETTPMNDDDEENEVKEEEEGDAEEEEPEDMTDQNKNKNISKEAVWDHEKVPSKITADYILNNSTNTKNNRSVKKACPIPIITTRPKSKREEKWIPPHSPFCLVFESLSHDPWKLLVATILLDKSIGFPLSRQPIPVLWKLLNRWPMPELAKRADVGEMADVLFPLGFNYQRASTIIQFSDEFLKKKWTYPLELHGIGDYGNDSYRIFCMDEWKKVEPTDQKLRDYQQWLNANEKQLGLV